MISPLFSDFHTSCFFFHAPFHVLGFVTYIVHILTPKNNYFSLLTCRWNLVSYHWKWEKVANGEQISNYFPSIQDMPATFERTNEDK